MSRGNVAEVDAPETTGEADTPTKPAAPAAPKREKLPEGYISPIEFRNQLEKSERVTKHFRPQVIYSYIRNSGKNNPFPVHMVGEEGKERPAIVLEEGFAWWDAKEQRKTEREANAAAKAEKAAAKAAETPAEAETAEVTEAE